jgi:hypothetical protein
MSAAARPGAARHSLEKSALEKSASASEESDRLEAAADQAIAACNGDMRSAIRALILANEYLEYELCEMFTAVSKGYARGRVKRKGAGKEALEKAQTPE